jgi:hypothetical protein
MTTQSELLRFAVKLRRRITAAFLESFWRAVPLYLGLSTIAIAQPMLDLYGKNLPVFSSAKVSRYEISVFVFIVVVFPVLIACLLEFIGRIIHPKSGLWIRRLILGLFGAIFILTSLRQLGVDNPVFVFITALLSGGGLVWLINNKNWAKTFVAYLAFVAPLVTGVFVYNTQDLLFPNTLPIASTNSTGVDDSGKPPVVLIVIDEAPLFSLLDAEGEINKERFPNLAQLSKDATWHRNAIGVSNWTAQAVPAIFTSLFPEQGDLPLASVHPKNIFTALADTYPLNVYEPITSLCPSSLCKSVVPIGERWNTARFRDFMRDALVVFGHRIFPKSLRDNLPRIDEGWGGFAGSDSEESANNEAERMSLLRTFGVLGPVYQTNILSELTTRMTAATTPEAYIAHLLVPHRPWRGTPDERVYRIYSPDVPQDVVPDDLDQRRTIYQRYLLQMGLLDTALGRMISDMKQANVWDESLVILAADHGLTLETGTKVRQAVFSNNQITDDLYRVPMFVKLPKQKSGGTTDCTVSVLDVLPTVLSVTNLETGWTFDGRDVSTDCPNDTTRKITSPSGEGIFANSIAMLFERSAKYDTLVSRSGGTDRIAAVGRSASLVGQMLKTNSSDSGVASWSIVELPKFTNVLTQRGALIPVQLKGVMRLSQQMPANAEGIITVNGVAAGVISEIGGAVGEINFDVVINYRLLTQGTHEVGLVLNFDGNGKDLRAGPTVLK